MRRILTTAICGALLAPAGAWAQLPPPSEFPTGEPVLGGPALAPSPETLPPADASATAPVAAQPVLGGPAPAPPTEVAPAEVDASKKDDDKKLLTKEKAGATVGGILGGLAGAAGGPLGKIAGSFVGKQIGKAVVGDDDKDKVKDKEKDKDGAEANKTPVMQAEAGPVPPPPATEPPPPPPVLAASPEAPGATVDAAATAPIVPTPPVAKPTPEPQVIAPPVEDPAAPSSEDEFGVEAPLG